MAELIKVHSLPGPDTIEAALPGGRQRDDFTRPEDPRYLRHPEISDFIAGVSGAKWVKVWISWFRMQGSFPAPSNIWSSWAQLASAHNQYGNYFARLDLLIKQINDADYGAILQVDENFPWWSNPTNYANWHPPGQRERVFPDDVSSNGPWGWWMSYLICRYKQGVPVNTAGPTQQNWYGNSKGASVYALEFCNEPNVLNTLVGYSGCFVAKMFTTIESIAAIHWPNSGPFGNIILGPSTSDSDASSAYGWSPFMKEVLSILPSGWQPRVYLGWSHHNYRDIDDTVKKTNPTDGAARLVNVRKRLEGSLPNDPNNPWRNGDRNVYITEGAPRQYVAQGTEEDLNTEQEATQEKMMKTAFRRVRDLNNGSGGGFPLFAQHQINDVPWDWVKYGLRRNWNLAQWAPSSKERPVADIWRYLPNDPPKP